MTSGYSLFLANGGECDLDKKVRLVKRQDWDKEENEKNGSTWGSHAEESMPFRIHCPPGPDVIIHSVSALLSIHRNRWLNQLILIHQEGSRWSFRQ